LHHKQGKELGVNHNISDKYRLSDIKENSMHSIKRNWLLHIFITRNKLSSVVLMQSGEVPGYLTTLFQQHSTE
jgi:hypothetical protein